MSTQFKQEGRETCGSSLLLPASHVHHDILLTYSLPVNSSFPFLEFPLRDGLHLEYVRLLTTPVLVADESTWVNQSFS